MLGIIGSILMVLTTVVPLVFTAAKSLPLIKRLFSFLKLLVGGRALLGRSPILGLLSGILVFTGGFAFIMYFYFSFGFELYLKFLDVVFTPFAWVAETLLRLFIDGLPNLPAGTSSVLCLFDFGSAFTLFFVGFTFEVYLRVLIYFLLRRK